MKPFNVLHVVRRSPHSERHSRKTDHTAKQLQIMLKAYIREKCNFDSYAPPLGDRKMNKAKLHSRCCINAVVPSPVHYSRQSSSACELCEDAAPLADSKSGTLVVGPATIAQSIHNGQLINQ